MVLWFMIVSYILYFSIFTILRSQNLYAHYFDLGIMHQTLYNTFEAIKTGDYSRFLEMTNPHGIEQMKRMAIHNDPILAFLAIFYFIYSGPETLLVIQSIVLGIGAFAVFSIVEEVLKKNQKKNIMGLFFAFSYLMYTPMQRANIYEFHAVTLATTFLLFMYYFWLKKKNWLCLIFLCFSLLTKEQVGLSTLFFGIYIYYIETKKRIVQFKTIQFNLFPIIIIGISVVWFVVSMLIIIPLARGGNHFALSYYSDFGNSPSSIFLGILKHPGSLKKYIFHIDTVRYFLFLLGPLGFLSLLSPFLFVITLPQFAINLLSNSWNMRNIIFHYTSVIQPFVYISAIYGTKKVLDYFSRFKKKRYLFYLFVICLFVICLLFSYFKGPLPFSREADLYPLKKTNEAKSEIIEWSNRLKNPDLKISSTGSLAPYFTSRRYYYHFPSGYERADFVVVKKDELYNYFDSSIDIMGVYKRLIKDTHFTIIYNSKLVVVYKKI